MKRGFVFVGCLAIFVFVFVAGAGARRAGRDSAATRVQAAGGAGGWTVPPNAAAEKNPLPVNEALLASGKKLYADKCASCHGTRGTGDGPDGDEAHQQDMDLTPAAGAAKNPDGVLFYKIWNGRKSAKMDPISAELSKDQVWAIVAYVQTLRARTGELR